eukprot:6188066-Pleurochrysis_carterae.AAC.2
MSRFTAARYALLDTDSTMTGTMVDTGTDFLVEFKVSNIMRAAHTILKGRFVRDDFIPEQYRPGFQMHDAHIDQMHDACLQGLLVFSSLMRLSSSSKPFMPIREERSVHV